MKKSKWQQFVYWANHPEKYEITFREILMDIIIGIIFLVIGIMITNYYKSSTEDKNLVYTEALPITEKAELKYCVKTNIGNAMVYGELSSGEPVSNDGVSGKFLYIERVHEHYTRVAHTTTTRVNGKTTTKTTYTYEWKEQGSDEYYPKSFTLLGKKFKMTDDVKEILASASEKEAIVDFDYSSSDRYVYYATPIKIMGTMFTNISSNTINDLEWYQDKTIQEVLDSKESDIGINIVLIWGMIVIVAGITMTLFTLAANRWLY